MRAKKSERKSKRSREGRGAQQPEGDRDGGSGLESVQEFGDMEESRSVHEWGKLAWYKMRIARFSAGLIVSFSISFLSLQRNTLRNGR